MKGGAEESLFKNEGNSECFVSEAMFGKEGSAGRTET